MERLWGVVKEALESALVQYGPGTVLLVLAVLGLFYVNQRLWRERLRDKDEEIRRMAKAKEHLEKTVLKNRLSSGLGASHKDSGDDAEPHRSGRNKK